MRRKFLGGVIGQGAGLASTIVIQLAQVPVLIWAIGAYSYGQYLLVIAAPSLLVLSDFGVLAAFSTAMLQAVASGKMAEARHLSRIASAILLSIGFVALLGLAAGSYFFGTSADFPSWAGPVFAFYGLYALVNIQTNAVEGILRAQGDQAKTWTYVAGLRFVEFAVAATMAVLTRSPVAFVVALLVARAVGTVLLSRRAHRLAPWSSRTPTFRGWRAFRYLVRPMAGSLAQPATNYVYLQATVIAVGALFGPLVVAQLSVLRTLSGLLKQGAQVFTIASVPIITHAAATNDVSALRARYRSTAITVASFAVPSGAVLVLLGPTFVSLWTHGSIVASPSLLLVFTIEAVCEAGLAVASMGLIAQNRHFALSMSALLLSLCYISAVWLLRPSSLIEVICLQIVTVTLTAVTAYILHRRAGHDQPSQF